MIKNKPLVDQVRDVLKPRAIVPIRNQEFLLQAEVMAVRVVGVRHNATVINFDKIGSLSGIKDQHQSKCDHLVLCQSSDSVVAVFVELKKTLKQEGKALEQLRSASPYLSFLTELSRIVGPVTQPLPRISLRHVLLGIRVTPLLDKLRLGDPQVLPDVTHRGITVRRLVGDRLRFSKLVGSY